MERTALLLATLATPAPAIAQEAAAPFVTVDQDRLFSETRYGQQLISEIRTAESDLAEENRRIEDELEAEERELTEKRGTMPAEEFRELADAFDEKVVAIRERQDTKQREVQAMLGEARQTFWTKARPILAELVRDKGAVAILNDRAVVLSARSIDITNEAIARIDDVLGAGAAASQTDQVPADAAEVDAEGAGGAP